MAATISMRSKLVARLPQVPHLQTAPTAGQKKARKKRTTLEQSCEKYRWRNPKGGETAALHPQVDQ